MKLKFPAHRLSVAPMMDWTDRHCRYFHRQLTRRTLLYTEMITSAALIHGDAERLLACHAAEHPLALQLGGHDPAELARAARLGVEAGYDEINLNVGCPSDRVQSGRFGACLMYEPARVRDCVAAMVTVVAGRVPVTVKCRVGVDDQDSEQDLDRFVDEVASGGCERFIIHCRKAWLKGLSPKENRTVPPLDYDRAYRLKQRRPDLTIVLNGGVKSLDEALDHLRHVDGVMIGRAAYQTPYMLAAADRRIFGDRQAVAPSRSAVLAAMAHYADAHIGRGGRLANIARHMHGLFHGQPGARAYRQRLGALDVKGADEAQRGCGKDLLALAALLPV